MKAISLKIDKTELKLKGPDSEKSGTELVTEIIKTVILNTAYQKSKGLSEPDRFKYYKICDAFDKAVKEKLELIELEDDWVGFIKKMFKDSMLVPDKLLRQVDENIKAVKDR